MSETSQNQSRPGRAQTGRCKRGKGLLWAFGLRWRDHQVNSHTLGASCGPRETSGGLLTSSLCCARLLRARADGASGGGWYHRSVILVGVGGGEDEESPAADVLRANCRGDDRREGLPRRWVETSSSSIDMPIPFLNASLCASHVHCTRSMEMDFPVDLRAGGTTRSAVSTRAGQQRARGMRCATASKKHGLFPHAHQARGSGL